MSHCALLSSNTDHNRTRAVIVFLIVLVCLGSQGRTQDSPDVYTNSSTQNTTGLGNGASGPTAHPLSVDVDLVLVPVSVSDAMNRPVTGLNKSAFALFEDGKTQNIRYFSSESAPMSIGILLDVSGTMARKIDAAREALDAFCNNSHPDDDYFVITFADRPHLIADSTRSMETVQSKLATTAPSGHTALLDAIEMGLMKLRSARHKRRALLIVSDGGDNWSRRKLRDIEKEVEESGDEVYAIGVFTDGFPVLSALDDKFGKRLLNKITEASGGRAIMVDDPRRLSEAAATLSKEMRTRYVLGYQSADKVRDGKWHRIKVKVASMTAGNNGSVRWYPAYKKGYLARLH